MQAYKPCSSQVQHLFCVRDGGNATLPTNVSSLQLFPKDGSKGQVARRSMNYKQKKGLWVLFNKYNQKITLERATTNFTWKKQKWK